jgi:hypothetical protein
VPACDNERYGKLAERRVLHWRIWTLSPAAPSLPHFRRSSV